MVLNANKQDINSIVKIIQMNNNLVQYDYLGKENQILISKELVNKINAFASVNEDDKEYLKELARQSIRKAFELLDTDIVICKQGQFFIKLLDKTKIKKVEEKDKGTISGRFNGVDEEELKSFYDEFFLNEDNKEFFPLVAKEFVEKFFKKQRIKNDDYEKNVFGYIQTIVFEHFISMYDNSDGFFQGFSGYVFRINFKTVFEYIADIILDEISMSNNYMIEFLKYYSQNVIVENGKRYKVPALEAPGGLQWNVVSMLSIAKIYTKTQKVVITLQSDIKEIDSEMSALYVDDLSPVEYQAVFIKKRQIIEDKISEVTNKLDKYFDSLELAKNDVEKENLEDDIRDIQNTIDNLRDDKRELAKKIIHQNVIKQYGELVKEKEFITLQLRKEQKIISKNKEAYLSMRNSLVKALISKKQQL